MEKDIYFHSQTILYKASKTALIPCISLKRLMKIYDISKLFKCLKFVVFGKLTEFYREL